MEAIKDWALSLCSVAVLGAAVNILSGGGRYDRAIKVAVAAVAVCALAVPVADISSCRQSYSEPSGAYLSQYSDRLENAISEQTLDVINDAARSAALDELQKLGVEDPVIETDAHTENGTVVISKVIIYLDEKYLPLSGRIEDRVYARLGVEVKLIAQ